MVLFVWLLIPLFWTSGDVALEFNVRMDPLSMMDSSYSPLSMIPTTLLVAGMGAKSLTHKLLSIVGKGTQ